MSNRELQGVSPSRSVAWAAEAGFTVLELVIAATITVAIMTVVLSAVDLNANITRVQADVSDLQQSTRVAQRDLQHLVRMTGRGGLPRARAIEVIQDAQSLQVGGANVVDGTDILTIRGTFSSPIFRVDSADPDSFEVTGSTATLRIDSVTKSAYEQPLTALTSLFNDDGTTPEAILLVGSQGAAVYAVVEMTEMEIQSVTLDVQNQARQVQRVILTLTVDGSGGGHAAEYLQLSATPGIFPANLTSVAFASVVEEHRFYIREDFAIPGDNTSPPSPKLARARMQPGTSTLHPDEGSIDIADNVFDLQIALGIDLDNDGRVDVEADDGTALAANEDEWLWNDEADDDTLAWDSSSLQHVRMTILGQAQTADRQYISPPMNDIENHVYDEPAVPTDGGEIAARRHRRRLLQSVVDLRNL